jgi:hypothetical protein
MTLEPGDHVWYWNGNVSQDLTIPRSAWFPGSDPADPNDYLGNGKDIYNYVIYDSEIARGRPHMRGKEGSYSWLNNNPGNLTGVAGGPDFGQYPDKFNWHHFLIFPTWDAGYNAIALFLRTPNYAGLSILEAFEKYAPAADGNDPAAYSRDVAAAAGVPESTLVGDLDDEQMARMQEKIMAIEGVVAGDLFAYDSPDLPAEISALLA